MLALAVGRERNGWEVDFIMALSGKMSVECFNVLSQLYM